METGTLETLNVLVDDDDAIQLGIHGYLLKPMSRIDLEEHVLAAVNSPPIDPATLPSE